MNSSAERFNGWMAMLVIVVGIGAYATTGQIIQVKWKNVANRA